jgi:protein disulfide-isomerase-like protein
VYAAPWCGHCKVLGPKYEKAATRMAIKGQSKIFAKVDAIENTVAKAKYEISGFPALKLFKHGKHIADYPGQRETDPLVAYIEKCAPSAALPSSATHVAFKRHALCLRVISQATCSDR